MYTRKLNSVPVHRHIARPTRHLAPAYPPQTFRSRPFTKSSHRPRTYFQNPQQPSRLSNTTAPSIQYVHDPSGGSTWRNRIIGFVSFPFIYYFLAFTASQGWIPGVELDDPAPSRLSNKHADISASSSSSPTKIVYDQKTGEFFEIEEETDDGNVFSDRELLDYTTRLARRNTQSFSVLLLDILTRPEASAAGLVVRDDALLASHPLRLASGDIVSERHASVVRVLDSSGKTRALILGVDIAHFIPPSEPPGADSLGVSYNWALPLSRELHRKGEASDAGMQWIFMTNRAIEVGFFEGEHASVEVFVTNHAEFTLPSGFPLAQLRRITPKGNAQ